MNDIEKILGEMEAYVEMHAKGWGSKDAAKDHLSQHALCYSATQYLPRLIAAVRYLTRFMELSASGPATHPDYANAMEVRLNKVFAILTGNNETTGTESNDAN
jgi:hypothetical protein